MASGSSNGGERTMKGRPKLNVDNDKLGYLRSLRYSWDETAALMGTSAKILRRRAKEDNIRLSTFSTIFDVEFDRIVRDVVSEFPGEVMIRGHLPSKKCDSSIKVCIGPDEV